MWERGQMPICSIGYYVLTITYNGPVVSELGADG